MICDVGNDGTCGRIPGGPMPGGLSCDRGCLLVSIGRCLDMVTTAGLRIQAFCLDRESWARKVMDFLTTVRIPFILPVRKHRRAMKQLLNGTKSRFGVYIMHGKPSLRLKIAIRRKNGNGKRGKHGVENPGYVVPGKSRDLQRIHKTCRLRFAIESSYRIRNLVIPRPSTRNPVFDTSSPSSHFILRTSG